MSGQVRRLAIAQLREHFGDLVKRVCEQLFIAPQTLRQLVVSTKMDLSEVQTSLFALLQHNLVKTSGSETQPLYELIVRNILLRARIPKMIHLVSSQLGSTCELIFEQILLHGRCRMSRVMGIIVAYDLTISKKDFVDAFHTLVLKRFIHRIPYGNEKLSPDMMFTMPDECFELLNESGSKRKRGTSVSNGSAGAAGGEDGAPSKKKGRMDGAGPGEDGEDGEAAKDESSEPDAKIYWVANYRQCHRHFRNNWIVDFMTQKLGAKAAGITKTILDLSVDDRNVQTALVSVEQHEILLNLPPSLGVTDGDIDQHLRVMCDDSMGVVRRFGSGYHVNINAAIGIAKRRAVERMIEERFGAKSLRLFRILLEHKHLEQDQLCSLAMTANFKGTRLLLNELFQARMVSVQEVPKQAERVPSRCYYLWSADLESVVKGLVERSYQTQANMKARAAAERLKYQRILAKEPVLNALPENPDEEEDPQVVADRELLQKVKGMLAKLEHAELVADEEVLLLRDFQEERFIDEVPV